VDLALYGNKADYLDRYRGHVAINVKYYGDPKISKETLAVLAKLDGATREQVLRFAEEGLRESWWAGAQERARNLGLGDLWSEGRSGGWLVLKMTVSELETLVDDAEMRCANCQQSYAKHTEGKCLFDSTTYASGLPSCEMIWANLKEFALEMKDSLQTAGDTFEEEILFQLENIDDDAATGFSATGGGESNPTAFDEVPEEEAGT
jgi:hypothetical protein